MYIFTHRSTIGKYPRTNRIVYSVGNMNFPMNLPAYLPMMARFMGNLWEISYWQNITHKLHTKSNVVGKSMGKFMRNAWVIIN